MSMNPLLDANVQLQGLQKSPADMTAVMGYINYRDNYEQQNAYFIFKDEASGEYYRYELLKLDIGDGSKVVYKFTENYISSNDREEKYVVSFPYTVKADVEQLLAQYDTITNYRVVAKLYLSDSKPTGASETKATESTEGCDIYVSPNATIESAADGMEDFFIFTVAKIKTDLDITQ